MPEDWPGSVIISLLSLSVCYVFRYIIVTISTSRFYFHIHPAFKRLLLLIVLQPFGLALVALFLFLIQYTINRTPLSQDQPVERSLLTQRTTQTQNKRTQTSMSQVWFEPSTLAFKWAKILVVYALEREASVISLVWLREIQTHRVSIPLTRLQCTPFYLLPDHNWSFQKM
jgi:hypothetical protein